MKGNVFFSTARNKAGNLITYLRYGEMCARGYSEAVAHPRNPKTSAQLMQRAKMSFIGKMFKGAAVILRTGLSDVAAASKMAAYSMAVKLNFPFLDGQTPQSITLDPSLIKVADGPIMGVVPSPTVDVSTPGKVIITVDDAHSGEPGVDNSDTIRVVLFNPDLLQWVSGSVDGRSSRTVQVNVPAAWEGQEAHAYIYATHGSQASPSAYVGHAPIG